MNDEKFLNNSKRLEEGERSLILQYYVYALVVLLYFSLNSFITLTCYTLCFFFYAVQRIITLSGKKENKIKAQNNVKFRKCQSDDLDDSV